MNIVPSNIGSEILSSQKTSSQSIAPPSVHINNTIVENYANQSISKKNSTYYLFLGLNDEYIFEEVKAADFADANKFKDENPELTKLASEIINGAKNEVEKIAII